MIFGVASFASKKIRCVRKHINQKLMFLCQKKAIMILK